MKQTTNNISDSICVHRHESSSTISRSNFSTVSYLSRKLQSQQFVKIWFMSSLIASLLIILTFSTKTRDHRRLWTYDSNTNGCEWEVPVEVSKNKHDDVYGTLLVSYPGSGMRATWQQIEGMSGLRVADDFYKIKQDNIKRGVVKTQYPHYEGIWSFDDNMDQVIMVIRNPMYAMISYHAILGELEYAHTWQRAYQNELNMFTTRPDVEDWIYWRDYRFDEEIGLWGRFLDFYMENGTQYWMDFDFERNGQWPFELLQEDEKPWPQAIPCIYYADCYPKAIVSYERLVDPATGVNEIRKIADLLRNQPGMNIIPDAGLGCIYQQSWIYSANLEEDRVGPDIALYNFTIDQLEVIRDTLDSYVVKYSSGSWANNLLAQELVGMLAEYAQEVTSKLTEADVNPPPTPPPNPEYWYNISEWYSSVGKGNRNQKAKVQQMAIWEYVKHLYD